MISIFRDSAPNSLSATIAYPVAWGRSGHDGGGLAVDHPARAGSRSHTPLTAVEQATVVAATVFTGSRCFIESPHENIIGPDCDEADVLTIYHCRMSKGVAKSIIVFGRGLEADGPDFCLSEASKARVRALVDYVEANKPTFSLQPARVIFSGGWSAAAAKMKAPPKEFREGALMLKYAHALPVSDKDFSVYADSIIEIESDSTLENVLRTKEAGYFSGISFTAANPLGIVAHTDHQKRIEYFIRKIFGLPKGAILHITAHGADNPSDGMPEKMLFLLTRLAFIGATSHSALRHRQSLALMAHHFQQARPSSDQTDRPAESSSII